MGRVSRRVMVVKLASVPNLDRYEGAERAIAATYVEVASFADAAAVCRRFITKHDLGSGNWSGGQVFRGLKLLARVSYNGRVWNNDGAPLTCAGCGALVTDTFGAPALAANGRCNECNEDSSKGVL